MDDQPEFQGSHIADRTMEAIRWMEDRVRANATGMDRLVVDQALPLIRPRLENRIRAVSEDALRDELKHVQKLITGILADEANKKASTKTKRKRTADSSGQKSRRTRRRP